jgi:hypothetical protein
MFGFYLILLSFGKYWLRAKSQREDACFILKRLVEMRTSQAARKEKKLFD